MQERLDAFLASTKKQGVFPKDIRTMIGKMFQESEIQTLAESEPLKALSLAVCVQMPELARKFLPKANQQAIELSKKSENHYDQCDLRGINKLQEELDRPASCAIEHQDLALFSMLLKSPTNYWHTRALRYFMVALNQGIPEIALVAMQTAIDQGGLGRCGRVWMLHSLKLAIAKGKSPGKNASAYAELARKIFEGYKESDAMGYWEERDANVTRIELDAQELASEAGMTKLATDMAAYFSL